MLESPYWDSRFVVVVWTQTHGIPELSLCRKSTELGVSLSRHFSLNLQRNNCRTAPRNCPGLRGKPREGTRVLGAQAGSGGHLSPLSLLPLTTQWAVRLDQAPFHWNPVHFPGLILFLTSGFFILSTNPNSAEIVPVL